MDVLIANPSYSPYLGPFLTKGASLKVLGNLKEAERKLASPQIPDLKNQ